MRILVTGANGQVGHELLRALHGRCGADERSPEGDVSGGNGLQGDPRIIIPATRSGRLSNGEACEIIDLADEHALRDALDRVVPDLIINAAAYTAVDRAEDEPELAQLINADAPGTLGAWASRHGARVVHYSTDYVFDGSATRPCREDGATNPVSVYGRSKLAGEIALRESGARHLLFRTAWVYAARGHNFMRTMLRLGAERDELRVVDDQIGAPTPAGLIADVSTQAIARWCAGDAVHSTALDGTYHLVTSGAVSWCGFARAIFERAQHAGLLARAPRVEAIRTEDYPTRARRPAYSVLDTSKLRETFGIALPDWQAGLDGVIRTLSERG
jgi:dTDP-4-dehydrorhamnose reductase